MGESAAIDYRALALPGGLDEIDGLVVADLRAIVNMLAERAGQTLLLSGRQRSALRRELWNRLVDSLNDAVASLDAERR
jgi:glutathione S-transferase